MISKTAIEDLFRQHYGKMTRLARTLLYDDEEAEDVVQDVFLRLMETDLTPSTGKIRAYLLTSVRNSCLNRIRQKSLMEQVRNLYPTDDMLSDYGTERWAVMLDAVYDYAEQQLREPHRTIFRLRFEQGMKLKDIAAELGMNLKTVFKYLSQSVHSIQSHFKDKQH